MLTTFETAVCFFSRPAWVTLVVVTAIQHVAAHFAFIKKDGGTTDLNNRYFLEKKEKKRFKMKCLRVMPSLLTRACFTDLSEI